MQFGGARYSLLTPDVEGGEDAFLRRPESAEGGGGDTFRTGGGLALTVVEPFRRWRLAFNGMMRRESDGEVVHVRMNLM